MRDLAGKRKEKEERVENLIGGKSERQHGPGKIKKKKKPGEDEKDRETKCKWLILIRAQEKEGKARNSEKTNLHLLWR